MSFYTIGHSTRSSEELVALLEGCGIVTVADVRAMPGSRRHPQFNADTLAAALEASAIGYRHVPALGGLRHRRPDVPAEVNGYWQNRSFHNFADYALGGEFAEGLAELIELGRLGHCALMCAEAVWWRCHRRIIADHLLHRGEAVLHIIGPGQVQPARLTPGAAADPTGQLVYPAVPA